MEQRYTESDMMEALNFAYSKGHGDGLLYDMPEMNVDKLSLVEWLSTYKPVEPVVQPSVQSIEDATKFLYCQSQVETDDKCEVQCEHCKAYYAPLEEQAAASEYSTCYDAAKDKISNACSIAAEEGFKAGIEWYKKQHQQPIQDIEAMAEEFATHNYPTLLASKDVKIAIWKAGYTAAINNTK